ncbi:hypothetical protein F2P79_010668 [Pimephales promelas]|nr:hypothetical protein F2P79_010668 [Pimephales promelas]
MHIISGSSVVYIDPSLADVPMYNTCKPLANSLHVDDADVLACDSEKSSRTVYQPDIRIDRRQRSRILPVEVA